VLDEDESIMRNLILESTNNDGIMTRPVWVLLSELMPFKHFPSMDLLTAHSLSARIVNIPSSPALGLAAS
jgi:perosamine synthetase